MTAVKKLVSNFALNLIQTCCDLYYAENVNFINFLIKIQKNEIHRENKKYKQVQLHVHVRALHVKPCMYIFTGKFLFGVNFSKRIPSVLSRFGGTAEV